MSRRNSLRLSLSGKSPIPSIRRSLDLSGGGGGDRKTSVGLLSDVELSSPMNDQEVFSSKDLTPPIEDRATVLEKSVKKHRRAHSDTRYEPYKNTPSPRRADKKKLLRDDTPATAPAPSTGSASRTLPHPVGKPPRNSSTSPATSRSSSRCSEGSSDSSTHSVASPSPDSEGGSVAAPEEWQEPVSAPTFKKEVVVNRRARMRSQSTLPEFDPAYIQRHHPLRGVVEQVTPEEPEDDTIQPNEIILGHEVVHPVFRRNPSCPELAYSPTTGDSFMKEEEMLKKMNALYLRPRRGAANPSVRSSLSSSDPPSPTAGDLPPGPTGGASAATLTLSDKKKREKMRQHKSAKSMVFPVFQPAAAGLASSSKDRARAGSNQSLSDTEAELPSPNRQNRVDTCDLIPMVKTKRKGFGTRKIFGSVLRRAATHAKNLSQMSPQSSTRDSGRFRPETLQKLPSLRDIQEGNMSPSVVSSDHSPGAFMCNDNTLRLSIGTWNLGGKGPNNVNAFVAPTSGQQHQLYVFGSQECEQSPKTIIPVSKKRWEVRLLESLGDEFVTIHSHSLLSLHLVAFAHRDLIPYITDIQSNDVKAGLGNVLGNKGAVGLSLTIQNTTFLFVNAHFAAHQENVLARNANYWKIDREMDLHPSCTTPKAPRRMSDDLSSTGQTLKNVPLDELVGRFDRVFWLGDLNYRIDLNRQTCDYLLRQNDVETLLSHDQLGQAMATGKAFPRFKEGSITFPPTYKFDLDKDQYDTGPKQRVPSWTDRILYHKCDRILNTSYNCISSLRHSDHRPVVAEFLVGLNTRSSQAKES